MTMSWGARSDPSGCGGSVKKGGWSRHAEKMEGALRISRVVIDRT